MERWGIGIMNDAFCVAWMPPFWGKINHTLYSVVYTYGEVCLSPWLSNLLMTCVVLPEHPFSCYQARKSVVNRSLGDPEVLYEQVSWLQGLQNVSYGEL